MTTSCSWLDARLQSKFEDVINEGKKEINREVAEAVNSGKDTIKITVFNSVQNASENLSEMTNKTLSDIKRNADAAVDREIDKKIKPVESKCNNAMLLALIAFFTGIIGAVFGIYAKYSLRDRVLRRKIEEYIWHSRELENRLRMLLDSSGSRVTAGYASEDIRKEVLKYVSSPAVMEYFVSELHKRKEKMPDSHPSCDVEIKESEKTSQTAAEPCILYARNTSNNILSDLSQAHQKGKTIYRLVLDDPDSKSARIELCEDKEDVVGRVLRFDNETLETVCSVTRMSNSPARIKVIKPGRAEKISGNEWKVMEKVELELM